MRRRASLLILLIKIPAKKLPPLLIRSIDKVPEVKVVMGNNSNVKENKYLNIAPMRPPSPTSNNFCKVYYYVCGAIERRFFPFFLDFIRALSARMNHEVISSLGFSWAIPILTVTLIGLNFFLRVFLRILSAIN